MFDWVQSSAFRPLLIGVGLSCGLIAQTAFTPQPQAPTTPTASAPTVARAQPHTPKPTPQVPAAVQVAVTYYQALAGQTDDDPSLSACGPTMKPWQQIALSRDLFHDAKGSKRCGRRARLVFADGRSLNVIVNDTMHSRFRTRADVLVPVTASARALGIDRATLHWL